MSAAAMRTAAKLGPNPSSIIPIERKRHADGERMRLRTPVGVDADDRLQQRRGDLTDERDEPDLPEAQAERLLQHRIDGWQKRLHQVVEQMAKTETSEDARRKLHANNLSCSEKRRKTTVKRRHARCYDYGQHRSSPLHGGRHHPTQSTGGVLCLPARHVPGIVES